MDIISITLAVAMVLSSGLGVFVFLSSKKSLSVYYYVLLVLAVSCWIGTNWLVTFVSQADWFAYSIAIVGYVSAIVIAYAFFYFCYLFPRPTFILRPSLRGLFNFLSAVVLISIFIPHFAILDVQIAPWKIATGSGIALMFGYFLLVVLVSFTVLISKLRDKNLEQIEKAQTRFVVLGYLLAVIFGIFFNLILPVVYQNYAFIRIGPIFTILALVSVAYGILRHKLFNAKVIATQLFVFMLWIFIFIRALLADQVREIVLNFTLLFLVVMVGLFLVKSVIREVEQREKIEKLARDLEEANENQQNLIHIMNHQIKGYLGKARIIFAELMGNSYGTVPDMAKPLIKEGFEQSTKGVDYVQAILRGASAASGMLVYDMKQLDLKEIVTNVVARQEVVAKERGLSFSTNVADGDYRITGDPVQLEEALRNLVENAIKYNRPNGSITVMLSRNGVEILFSVKDTGYGVADDVKSRLFTPGGRSKDSIRYNTDSSGFGLAFVKGVIEKHAGVVGYAPNAGEVGTTFYAKLPVDLKIRQ